jgi:hypothetical protein
MLTNDRFSKSILEFPKMDKKNVQFSKSHCTFEAKKRKFTMWGMWDMWDMWDMWGHSIIRFNILLC